MKLVKNNAPRLITLNHLNNGVTEKYRLIPAGKPVPVPDDVLKSRFAKQQIKSGNISIMGSSEVAADESGDGDDDDQGDDLEDLREEAKALGIEIDGRWGEKRLRAEIEKALEA